MEQGCTLSALRLSETGDLRHSHKRRSRSLPALLVLFGVATSSRSFRHQALFRFARERLRGCESSLQKHERLPRRSHSLLSPIY